jgi:hypothetical protein
MTRQCRLDVWRAVQDWDDPQSVGATDGMGSRGALCLSSILERPNPPLVYCLVSLFFGNSDGAVLRRAFFCASWLACGGLSAPLLAGHIGCGLLVGTGEGTTRPEFSSYVPWCICVFLCCFCR